MCDPGKILVVCHGNFLAAAPSGANTIQSICHFFRSLPYEGLYMHVTQLKHYVYIFH